MRGKEVVRKYLSSLPPENLTDPVLYSESIKGLPSTYLLMKHYIEGYYNLALNKLPKKSFEERNNKILVNWEYVNRPDLEEGKLTVFKENDDQILKLNLSLVISPRISQERLSEAKIYYLKKTQYPLWKLCEVIHGTYGIDGRLYLFYLQQKKDDEILRLDLFGSVSRGWRHVVREPENLKQKLNIQGIREIPFYKKLNRAVEGI